MRATILCSGPSLAAYDPKLNRGEVTIAVNRAVEFADADFWAFRDPASRGWIPKGPVRPFCPVDPRMGWVPEGAIYWDDTNLLADDTESWWSGYTVFAAIWLAADLGATEIEVWGADMGGTQDFAGSDEVTLGARDKIRWERERLFWGRAEDALAAQGRTLKRCGLSSCPADQP